MVANRSALFAIGFLAAVVVVNGACTASWTFFPPDASRECNGSGSLWYPLDTGIPTATCTCTAGTYAAVVVTANMDPLNNPGGIFGIQKPRIVNIDANGGSCMNADWGGGSFTRRWFADCYEGTVLSLSITRDQVIRIIDIRPPNITLNEAPFIRSTCTYPIQMPARLKPTCVDNCDKDVDFAYSSYALVGFCTSNTVVVRNWTCSDGCGNRASATQYESFTDTTAPVIAITFPASNDPGVSCCSTSLAPGCSTGVATQSDECDYTVALNSPSYKDQMYTDPCGTVFVNRTWSSMDCASNPGEYLQKMIVDIAANLNSLNNQLSGLSGSV